MNHLDAALAARAFRSGRALRTSSYRHRRLLPAPLAIVLWQLGAEPFAAVGAAIYAIILAMALFAPELAPYDPRAMLLQGHRIARYLPISTTHWLGTTAGGHYTNSASGITRWRFAFDNYPSKSKYASATIVSGCASRYSASLAGPSPRISSNFLMWLIGLSAS